MQITTNVTLNLQTPDYSVIYEPQGNNLSRFIHVQLMDGSAPWTVPAGTLMTVRYLKPDGTFGMYDTNENNASAYTISGSTVDVELVSQMLTVAGNVAAQLDFYNAAGQHLSTFSFRVAVEESPITDGEIESSDYFNVLTATLAEAQQIWLQVKSAYGAPRTANKKAAMTDHSLIYVYTGTTTSALTNGHWYFWNGSAWTDGGVYNSTAFTTDTTLTIAGAAADAKATGDAVGELKSQLKNWNSYDVLRPNATYNNGGSTLTFEWNADKTACTFSGSSTSNIASNLIVSSTALPDGFIPGNTYYVSQSTTDENIRLQIITYKNSSTVIATTNFVNETDEFTIPSNCTGIVVRLFVGKNTEVNGVVSNLSILNTRSNKELSELVSVLLKKNSIEISKNTLPNNSDLNGLYLAKNQYSNSNTYNVSPSITTDTNNYLQPTGDNTDVAGAIMTMLTNNGCVNLGPGEYYVTGVDMPDDTEINGSGPSTKIILLGTDQDSGYAVKLGSRCTITNCSVLGSNEDHTSNSSMYPAGSKVERHGILWQGAFSTGGSTPRRAIIDGCYIANFSGGGICLCDTGTNVTTGISISNCNIWYCYAGIDIEYSSEFNRIVNCGCTNCLYGCINNGGNNHFSNCVFAKNGTGMLIDNTANKSPNRGHGSVQGCNFDHAGGNTGYGVYIIKNNYGEVFTNCQFHYAGIRVEESDAIVFGNCLFNHGVDGNGELFYADGNGLILFNGCAIRHTFNSTLIGSNAIKYCNDYMWDGNDLQ